MSYRPVKEVIEMDDMIPFHNRKKRQNLLVGFGVATVIGVSIGLAVGLTKGNTNTPNENAQSPKIDISIDKSTFSRSSSFMNKICSKEERRNRNLDIVGMIDFCEEECEVAKCCDPLLATADNHDASSCISNDASLTSCIAYAKCQRMVDPAPLDLPEVCSEDQLALDRTACEAACEPASCCIATNEADRCLLDRFLMCMDYAPCQNLRSDTKLPVAPSNLDELCQNDNGNVKDDDKCQSTCDAAASCCADSDCFPSNFIACASHAACGFLQLEIPHNQVTKPAVPSELETKCDPTVLTSSASSSSSSREDCINACAPADCCIASGLSDNCFLTDPFGCLDYKHCSYLEITGGSVPVAPDNIQEVCTLQNILQNNNDASDACADICQTPEASCCFEWSPNKNCIADGNAYACGTYYPCVALVASFVPSGGTTLASPDPSISEKCSTEAIQADDTLCHNLCEPASCCTSFDNHNCFFENPHVCGEYAVHCAKLSLPHNTIAPTPPENLSDICPIGSSILGKASAECQALCDRASCCTTIDADSCTLNSPKECAQWLIYCL